MVIPPGQKNEKYFDLKRTVTDTRQNDSLARVREN